ncbi:MAG: type IV toxin-antitoxin system AbiEi family antitoxin domain-containing protein [Armatimonadota bacterium]
MDTRTNGYGQTQGMRLLQQLNAEGCFVFTTNDAAQAAERIGIGRGYVRELLLQLLKTGWLIRIKRGTYAWTGSLPGGNQMHPFVVATRLVQPSAIAYWSAMSHHGLTEQVPQAVSCCTPKKVVTPSMRHTGTHGSGERHAWEIGGIRYEYTTVKPEHFFGMEEVWIDQSFRVPITDRERTVLDLFAHPRMFGGMGEAIAVLTEHVDTLDTDKLVSYAVQYAKSSVARRLGWTMSRAGIGDDVLTPLLAMITTGIRPLDPTRPIQGPCDSKWRVQDNIGRESTR